MLPYFIELQELCRGSVEAFRREPVFATKCWYNSPFMITRENIEVGMRAREVLGQPFTLSTMPVAGIATPATLAGAVVQIIAEVLGCNVISLALSDRLCGYCAGPMTFDMRTGIRTQTGPDVQLLRNACAQMGAYIFGGGYTAIGGTSTAAKTPGAQSAMEKALDTMWAVCGGVRKFGSLGTLAFADVGSAVQLMLDLEMMSHLQRLLKGVTVDDERIAYDLICETAPPGRALPGQRAHCAVSPGRAVVTRADGPSGADGMGCQPAGDGGAGPGQGQTPPGPRTEQVPTEPPAAGPGAPDRGRGGCAGHRYETGLSARGGRCRGTREGTCCHTRGRPTCDA